MTQPRLILIRATFQRLWSLLHEREAPPLPSLRMTRERRRLLLKAARDQGVSLGEEIEA